ncbi:uncharacterized protein LOC126278050 isoform X4 [Schistocerca gregaria]|uniref:uncharacterized protein LOC126278050 isoform X4 n=1 Tax=Schistocerca gregaria TaxID=7010 RepID=UPI00211E5328|nr:uncharacterized protein LOC126278050 isoform X4 [Schistocerca gregaria]
MEGQGFSFGQPVSIVCPVIRAPQRAVQEEQQRCAAPEPLVAPAYVPRRRQGSGAVGNAGRSSVLRTVAANQPTAADADNSRPVVRYVGRDGDTSPPGSAPRADDTPAETPAALDPLLLLCQAAQQQGYESLSETEENEQQVAVGPEVHAGEPSFADTSPESTDAGQYGESVDGHRELPVEEHHELSVQQQHELPVEEQHELPSQQHHELPVGEHHEPPVQESHELPASSTIPIAMRVNGLEVSCQFRQLDLTGTALLPADGVAGQGALTVAVAPVYEESGVPQPPTEKFIFLYPDPSSVFEAPVPQVAVPATGQSDSSALCQYSGGEAHQRSEWQLKAIEFNNPDSMMACYERDDKARPPDSGRDSPFLKCSVQHGKRALHLDCDLEKCCKSSDDHSYAAQTLSVGDSTAQLSEIVEASPSVALQELAPTECPQSAEGESQKPDEEADVTIATPDSTGETLTAGARAHLPEGPVREETVLCTSEVEPNSDTTESDVNSRATAAPDAVVTTVTSQDGTAGENSKTPDDRLDDSAPNDCHTNGEVRNAATAPLGRRRKNPVRRHILPATPPAGRKPVGRKRAAAAPPDAAVVRRGRKKRAAQPDPPEEPEKQHARANAYTAQELILPEQVAKAASERPNGVSNTGSTLRRGGGRRRRGAEPGRRRRPAAALADSTVDEEVATVARDTHRKKGLRDTAARRAAKASRRCCVQWTLQPLSGQDPPLRLIVKRTLTVSESSDLAAEYAANEDITSPKPGPRGRRHSTNDCQSNRRESQMDNSLRFSQNVDQPDSSVQWRKRRNPVSLSSVDGEEDVSNDADDDEEDEDDDDDYDDEDWVPKSYKYRKSVAGAHSNLSKRVHLAKRRKSINVGADDYLKISCVKTVETVTASPEQVAETNKEESLITSTDTMHLPEREKTAVVETTVTAIVDTPKSSVEEHVPDTTEVTVTSHSTTECSQPLVSQIQHKVSCDTYETCQEPAPKKYKKAWQELWSAQQNNVSSLPEVACRSKELQHGEERCTRDLTQPPTAETQVVASPSSSSHVDQQDTSEGQCKGKDCYRRKEVAADSEKHGSDNKTIVIQISDSDDDCSGNNSAKSGKIQGGDETKNERGQRSHRTFRTERRRKKKVIIFKKINGEYRTTERSVNVVQQESSSLSKVVEESPPHGRSSQLPSTEELARDISSHSQKHIEQVTQCEHDIQVPESFYHSSSINLQSNFIPLNDSNRPLLDKEDPNKSSTCLPDSAEESNNSKANDALKMKGSAQQFQEMTEEKTQDIHLSNSQHEKLQHDITKRKLASAEEITESENQISISAVPRPDMHLSVNKDQSASPQLNSSLPVPGNNCLREATTPKSDGETENVSLDHSKLVTGNDRKHSEKRDEPKLAHLTVDTDCRVQKSCEASNNIDKKQTDGIHGGALNKLCQETCESSGDMVMRQDTNIHQADMNDVTQEPCEISRNVVKKVADDTHEIDLNNVALKTFEASDNILLKQVDKAQGADLNDVGVKERLFAAQISTKHDSKSRGDVRQSKEESKLELHCDENQQQHFNTDKQHSLNETNEMSQSNNKQNTEDTKMENSTDNMTNPEDLIDEMEVTGKLKKPDETTNELEGIAVAREETQDNSNKETLSPGAVCVTSNCEYVTTDTNLRERINLKDTSSPSHVVTTVAADSETPQPGAEVSSGNLIDQLLQSQQNSKVFDPLVSLIKTRPIVGDSALRYEMMVKKELARIYQKEAKQKKKKSKKQISSAGKSETKKTKKKPKGFCSFRGNDKGMDGCGPGKGGFGGDTFTFTAIVRSYGGDCISNLYRSLSTKGVNIHKKCKALMKQSTDFSNSLDITCWLLYFGFQHVCLFSI